MICCAAAIGVPLTHRGLAHGVRYVTGHCQGDAALDFDWSGLADPDTTLVVYMGFSQIGEIAARLGTTSKAVETRLARARARLRADLSANADLSPS